MAAAFDNADNIIIVEYGNDRLQVLRYSDGSHVRTIGSHGSEHGKFEGPWGVLIDGQGRIIVSDCNNHRIQMLH